MGEGEEGPTVLGRHSLGCGRAGLGQITNDAEQQSAMGSGDLKHVMFVSQVPCPRRVGGGRLLARLLPQQGLAEGWAWGDVPCPGCLHPTSASIRQPSAVGTGLRSGSCCVQQECQQLSERGRERWSREELFACNILPNKNVRKKSNSHKSSGTCHFFPNDIKLQQIPISLCCRMAEFVFTSQFEALFHSPVQFPSSSLALHPRNGLTNRC